MSPSRVLAEKMKELKDLAEKSPGIQILDYDAYGAKIQQIFQRVKEATTSFLVCTVMFIYGQHIHISGSQVEMAMSIQQTASEIRDDRKVSI